MISSKPWANLSATVACICVALSTQAENASHGDSADRARQRDFDAEDTVKCSQNPGEDLGMCEAAVARGSGGDATVVVEFANGFQRTLFFESGAFASANATMSGNGTDTSWRLEDGIYRVRVDDQHYELPEGLVVGQ